MAQTHPLMRDLDEVARTAPLNATSLLRWLVTAAAELPPVPRPPDSERRYTRTRLYATEDLEVLVLHWSAGASTPVHDHGGQRCRFALMQGEISVETFVRRASVAPGAFAIDAAGSAMLKAGDVDYSAEDSDLHRCTAKLDAITLHVYARPLTNYHTYDLESGVAQQATSTYDAVLAMESQP